MFDYGDVALDCELHQRPLQNTREVRMGLSEDSLMKPFREMAGLPAPGEELGGWYMHKPAPENHTRRQEEGRDATAVRHEVGYAWSRDGRAKLFFLL